MANISIYAANKKVYTSDADAQQRGFFAYLRRLQEDAAAAEAADAAQAAKAAADALKKAAADAQKAARAADAKAKRAADEQQKADAQKAADAAQQKAKAAAEAAADAAAQAASVESAARQRLQKADAESRCEAIHALKIVLTKKGLRAADFTKDYLIVNNPLRFNAAQQLCKVTRVELADEQKTREAYKGNESALIEREDGYLYIYKPIHLFTANSLLSEFTRAADAKAKRAADAQKAKASAESAARKRASEDAILARAKEIQAKRAAESAASAESK